MFRRVFLGLTRRLFPGLWNGGDDDDDNAPPTPPLPRRNPNSNAARSFRRGVCGRGSGWDWDGGSGAGAAWSTKAKRSPMKGTDSEGFYGGGGGCGGACPTSKEEEGREEERWNA